MISSKEDPDRSYLRNASQFSQSETARESNFAGAYGCHLGYRLDPAHTISIDVTVANTDNAGAALLLWSSPPSFSDAIQQRAHECG